MLLHTVKVTWRLSGVLCMLYICTHSLLVLILLHLQRKLEEAQKVIEHERTEEAQLRQTIAELESGNKGLMVT